MGIITWFNSGLAYLITMVFIGSLIFIYNLYYQCWNSFSYDIKVWNSDFELCWWTVCVHIFLIKIYYLIIQIWLFLSLVNKWNVQLFIYYVRELFSYFINLLSNLWYVHFICISFIKTALHRKASQKTDANCTLQKPPTFTENPHWI